MSIETTGKTSGAARLGEHPPDRLSNPIATSSVELTAPKIDDSDRGTLQHPHTTSLKPLQRLAFSLLSQATPIAKPTIESVEFDTREADLEALHNQLKLGKRHNATVPRKNDILQTIARENLGLDNWQEVKFP